MTRRLRRVGRAGLGAVIGVALLLTGSTVEAMGLGAATIHSRLGEPLRMSFPVSVQNDEEVGCVQVRSKGDDLPGVINTRAAVIRNGFQARIEIRSIQPIDEPAIGLVVTVGCASPISREYVVFLDPPVVAATTEAPADGARALPPVRSERATPVRRAPVAVAPSTPREARPPVRRRDPTTTTRAPRTRPSVAAVAPAAPAEAPRGSSQPSTRPSAPASLPSAASKGDRLTVVPTEAGQGSPTSTPAPASGPVSNPVAAPIASAPSAPAVPATPTAAASASSQPPSPVAPAIAPSEASLPAADAGGDVAAREQAARQQQAALQQQIKALSDQIAALKVQTNSLVVRNQELEQTGFAPWLIWLLIALAVLAIVVAGWMAWRYTQLRRSIEGAAWWTGNTNLAPADAASIAAETRGGLASLDPGTRLAPRAPEAPVPPSGSSSKVSTSNVERPRPAPKAPQRYPTPIDTDFTVSDIEAAMATVRTVSPPRNAPRPSSLDDGELTPLGGPTLPSPFTDPPPPPSAHVAPLNLDQVQARPADDAADFVDIDIPPMPTSRASAPTPPFGNGGKAAPTEVTGRFADDETEPLDFKLDIPNHFDPLATDSMKTTVVDGVNRPADFDLPPITTSLDFELPSATQIASLTSGLTDSQTGKPRHGAGALDDLFASGTGPGIDTILNLDDRDGAPLSTTEVDRLTSTAVEGPNAPVGLSTRGQLARFADLMNQIDEVEDSDPLRAIAMLRQYVLRDESIPTLLWLRLFQLYRKVDKKSVYEALAEHFMRRYNRPMVSWEQNLADRVPQSPLSAMGHIDREIEALWGREEGLERIRSLLCDRDQDDAVVFDAVLQRDLLDAAKVFPASTDSQIGGGHPASA